MPDLDLAVSIGPYDGRVRHVCVGGELDVATAGQLLDRLTALLPLEPGIVLVDLAELRFCDAAGLQGLLTVRAAVQGGGGSLTCTGGSPMLRRMLEITGLSDLHVPDGTPDRTADRTASTAGRR